MSAAGAPAQAVSAADSIANSNTAAAAPSPTRVLPGCQFPLFNGLGLGILGVMLCVGLWFERPVLVLGCSLLLATAAVGWTWASLALRALSCRAALSASRGFPGDKVILSMTLDNRKPLPVGWTLAEIPVPDALAPGRMQRAHPWPGRAGFGTALGAFERVTWERELTCRKRGEYELGPPGWLSGDGFGLYLNAGGSDQRLPFVVYPRLYEMEDLGLPARHPVGELRDPTLLFEDTSRPRGLRDYTSETPFKKIAWNASARTGKLKAKVFEPTASVQTTLFLAVDRFGAGDESEDLFELGVSTAASVACRLSELRQPVGLLCNGTLSHAGKSQAGALVIGAGRGEGHIDAMLESLALLKKKPIASFHRMLELRADTLSSGSTLCVVAERLEDADVERLIMLRQHGCGILVLIVGGGPMPEGVLNCRRVFANGAAGIAGHEAHV